MKVSSRGKYGLRAIIDIASQEAGKCVTIKSVSKRQGISEHYLEQLVVPLKKSGIVKSVRGSQGGYILNVPASEISVGDILKIMEGSLKVVDCNSINGITSCGMNSCDNCVTKSVWLKIYESINDVVDNIPLSDLVEDYKLLTDYTDDILV